MQSIDARLLFAAGAVPHYCEKILKNKKNHVDSDYWLSVIHF
jgi:hypothetical protein